MDIAEAQRIVKDYGEALKRASAEVGLNPLFPLEALPFPKSLVKESIRAVYAQEQDYSARSFLMDAYVKLAAFVPVRQVEEVADWLKGGITGDPDLERTHHTEAVSILSRCSRQMEGLRKELLEAAPAQSE